jgi:hypothetical protein
VKTFEVRYINNEGSSRWTTVQVGDGEGDTEAKLQALEEDFTGEIHQIIDTTEVASDE